MTVKQAEAKWRDLFSADDDDLWEGLVPTRYQAVAHKSNYEPIEHPDRSFQ